MIWNFIQDLFFYSFSYDYNFIKKDIENDFIFYELFISV